MECPRCGAMNPVGSVLCDCGVRLDIVGFLPGKSRPSLSFLWQTVRNWSRLKEARSAKAERVRKIDTVFQRLGKVVVSQVNEISGLPVDGPETARRCIEVNEVVQSYRSWI